MNRHSRWTFRLRFVVFLALMFLGGRTSSVSAAKSVDFNRDIRPILSDNCFQCHGPDEKQRQAKLRLDGQEFSRLPAESGKIAVAPGNPAGSELVARLTSPDDTERMPPADSGKKLNAKQIELLTRWVEEGAEYQGHWAFTAIQRPAVPDLPPGAHANLAKNAIDHFVLTQLFRRGLTPAGEASKETLIRRLSLDLTGLPPTPAEVDAFLGDTSPSAYERLVDRLLESPRYGERMAVQWLDFARYADSNGFQIDSSRQMWPWRNWVIDAYNQNMPFDRFTVEQLAGDLLPNPTRSQLVATGFNRNHRLNGEGGIIAEEWRVETVIDRVETTGLTWLALTLNCCRCHDHKYDPITQKEFYQLYSLFNNVAESGTLQGESKNTDPILPVPTAEQEAELAKLLEATVAAEANLKEEEKRLPELVAAWEPMFRRQLETMQAAWIGLKPLSVKSLGGATFEKQPDESYLVLGPNPAHDIYEITAPIGAGNFSGLLLDCFPDKRLPNESLGRYSNGNFVLTKVEVEITADTQKEPLRPKWMRAEADYSQAGWHIQSVNDGNPANGWAVDGPTKRDPRKAMFLAETPITVPENATITVRLFHEALNQHNIGRFRLSITSLPPATVKLDGLQFSDSLRQILAKPGSERNPAEQAELTKFFRQNTDNPVAQAESRLADVRAKADALRKASPNVMVMRELDQPRDAYFLIRGQYDRRGEKVSAGLPVALPKLPDGEPLNRLGLAKWLIAPNHPLTARVWVNRAWERFFGTGLVKTTENLGSQAEFPSHPELLDWLAAEFMTPTSIRFVSGKPIQPWDMKGLHKLIVMSGTYRQDSKVDPKAFELDPENRLLARGPRFRLSAEMLRDQSLLVSGLLVEKIGGPSVRPYMPDGVWDETSVYGDLRNYKHDVNEGLYRRTIYTVWKRTAAPPTMLLFDAPNREVCTVQRSRTNTPLQALSLLNEVTFVEAARKLAERMIREGGATPESRIEFGFRLVASRRPTAEERGILVKGITEDIESFRRDPESSRKLSRFGESKASESIEPPELAAYALAANVLLNLDEVVTRE